MNWREQGAVWVLPPHFESMVWSREFFLLLMYVVIRNIPLSHGRQMFSLEEIRDCFCDRPALRLEPEGYRRAAVAMVICDAAPGTSVLFIRRSEHERDPWSGQLGFPGGRVDPSDPEAKATAEREMLEEVGVDLVGAEYLGRLDDSLGRIHHISVSCFVYGVRDKPPLVLDQAEVASAFWCPITDLVDPARRREQRYQFRGEEMSAPAIQVLETGPYLWGLTHRFVTMFLDAMGRSPCLP